MKRKILEMLSSIDRQDLNAFGTYLSDDARFIFGNGDAIHGREAIVLTVQGVLRSLRSISHTVERFWQIDSVVIWPEYPNLGIDSRNQHDFIADLPGGAIECFARRHGR